MCAHRILSSAAPTADNRDFLRSGRESRPVRDAGRQAGVVAGRTADCRGGPRGTRACRRGVRRRGDGRHHDSAGHTLDPAVRARVDARRQRPARLGARSPERPAEPDLAPAVQASGAARQITNGLDSYSGVSLSGDGRSLVWIAGVQEATLWVLGSTAWGTWAPRLGVDRSGRSRGRRRRGMHAREPTRLHVARERNLDIWSLNLESGVRRQLTSAAGPEIAPAVSPDGSLIAFASTREAARRIWVMDSSGGNQRPLSAGPVDVLPFWSADGKRSSFSDWAATTPGASLSRPGVAGDADHRPRHVE